MADADGGAVAVRVRVADPVGDSSSVAEIYARYVTSSVISFEEVPPSADEMRERIARVLDWAPWLVADDENGRVIGYAYASRHRERAGYRWSVDLAVYSDASVQRRGVGRSLYAELLPILRRQRFINAYAGIGLPNNASVALHKSIGMALVAVYEKVGWKLGRWVDVAWYGMRLVDGGERADDAPPEPIPFSELSSR